MKAFIHIDMIEDEPRFKQPGIYSIRYHGDYDITEQDIQSFKDYRVRLVHAVG